METESVKRRKKSNSNFKLFTFSKLLLIIGIILVVYSLFNIIKWNIHSNKTKKIIDNINNEVIIEKHEDNKITADLSNLKNINSDTVGWIKVEGTNVNYPFVQTSNNDFYLNHSFDKSYNLAGWIFLDYRNNTINFDKNTILYGHGRLDSTMFGSLMQVFDKAWYENNSNHFIKISTDNQSSIWQIFSIYHIPVTDDYIKINFNSDEDFLEFIEMLKNRSVYNFNVDFTSVDNIITLSTCYKNDSNERLVIHAKRIK